MKPMVETALEKKTVQQAIEAIRDRVDALGVSEPQIQEYGLGDNQILVDLPGVENESQIESIIQGTNRLEIHAVVGGPLQGRAGSGGQRGRQHSGGRGTEEVLRGDGGRLRAGERVCLQRASVVAGNDFRSADPGTDPNTGQREVQFTLTNEAGDKFYDYTSKNVGQSMAVVMNDRSARWPPSRAPFATGARSRQLHAG
jgi:preprotein translocase subunit SecD